MDFCVILPMEGLRTSGAIRGLDIQICILAVNNPPVAQLVERWTVACKKCHRLESMGRWFESGLEDFLTYYIRICSNIGQRNFPSPHIRRTASYVRMKETAHLRTFPTCEFNWNNSFVAWAEETLIRRFHGPSNSIAEDIQLQRLRFWSYAISATTFRADSFRFAI